MARVLACGDGWTVSEVICHSGPHNRPFEERHTSVSVALVVGGTFQYRSVSRTELMTPGSVLLGNAGQSFECAHEHGLGDRCISFSYQTGYFDRIAFDAGSRSGERRFRSLRLPPLRVLAGQTAWASAASARRQHEKGACEEVALRLSADALQLDRGTPRRGDAVPPAAFARA